MFNKILSEFLSQNCQGKPFLQLNAVILLLGKVLLLINLRQHSFYGVLASVFRV